MTNLTPEGLRPIPGYDNYSITKYGYVYSKNKNGYLCPVKDQRGGFLVTLCQKGVCKNRKIHSLVAEVYMQPKPENARGVRHKNGMKEDNYVKNLEWLI